MNPPALISLSMYSGRGWDEGRLRVWRTGRKRRPRRTLTLTLSEYMERGPEGKSVRRAREIWSVGGALTVHRQNRYNEIRYQREFGREAVDTWGYIPGLRSIR